MTCGFILGLQNSCEREAGATGALPITAGIPMGPISFKIKGGLLDILEYPGGPGKCSADARECSAGPLECSADARECSADLPECSADLLDCSANPPECSAGPLECFRKCA